MSMVCDDVRELLVINVNETVDEFQGLSAEHIVDGLLPIIEAESKKIFDKGVLYACARIIELHDQPVIARDVLKESGADIQLVDEHDIQFLKKMFT